MCIKIEFGCRKKTRIIPGVENLREIAGVVKPSPQFQGPRRGKLLMSMSMTDSQQVTLTVAFVDKKGQPASVDAPPQWFVDNTAVVAIQPAADGMSCVALAVGPLGQATVSVKASSGGTDFAGSIDITITSGNAVSAVITPGTPTEQP